MDQIHIGTGVVHEVPDDLKTVLTTDSALLGLWNGLTPLARNEWICWVTHVKKVETRKEHIRRLSIEVLAGKRRPCCWPGCPHRNLDAE